MKKTIKKEFIKLFPEGFEINKKFKIVKMYGIYSEELFMCINKKNIHCKIKNYIEEDYKKLQIVLIKYYKEEEEYKYKELSTLSLDDDEKLAIHNIIEVILNEVGEEDWI